jgi:hypothetical protein
MPVIWQTNCRTCSILVLLISSNINHTLHITVSIIQKLCILPTHFTLFVCFVWFSHSKQRLLHTTINEFFFFFGNVHATCFLSCRICSVKNIIYISVMFQCGDVIWCNVTYKLFIWAAINLRVGIPASCHLQSFLSPLPGTRETPNRFIAYEIWYWDFNINVSNHSRLG